MTLKYLEVPTKDARYTYTTGRIRGLEIHLLQEADLNRLREARGIEEAMQILGKITSYSESLKNLSPEKFEKGLGEELRRTYQDLRSFCPHPELVDLFWLDYDFHNLKVLLKSHVQSQPPLNLVPPLEPQLSPAGTQDEEILKEAVREAEYSHLLPEFKTVIQEAIVLMETHPHPQVLDSFIDRHLFEWLRMRIEEYHDFFLTHLIELQIDSFNIQSFLRIKLWEEANEKELLERVLVEKGTVEKKELVQLASQPKEALGDRLDKTDYGEPVKKALEELEREESLFGLGRFFDSYILEYTGRGYYITFGKEPLVNYILLKKKEIKTLRQILREKLMG
jgi:V/A-type H+-transporting ATPase subunit C